MVCFKSILTIAVTAIAFIAISNGPHVVFAGFVIIAEACKVDSNRPLLNNQTWESQGPKKFNVLAAAGVNVNTGAKTLKGFFFRKLSFPTQTILAKISHEFQ